MVGLIAFALGALAVTGLITIGFMKALRRWNAEIPGLLIANVLSLITATIIGGFTLAGDRDPVFAEAFAQYFLPQLVVLLWTLYRYNRRKRDLIEHAKAFHAFSAAFRSFGTLSKLPAEVDVEIRSALLNSAVVSYGGLLRRVKIY